MQTRRLFDNKRKRITWPDESTATKRRRAAPDGKRVNLFDALPDDLVVSILCKLSSTAASPADFINTLITCQRMKELAQHPLVLRNASAKSLAVGAKKWSDSAQHLLKRCAEAGNLEASYTLGMIHFYCLQKRGSGASLMARAAIGSHAAALYSLAIIQFNGSGGSKSDKNLRAGVSLCARAASFGHVDALRELGHCLQDGYGVRQNVAAGRRFLVQANTKELAAVLCSTSAAAASAAAWLACQPHDHHHPNVVVGLGSSSSSCPLLSDYGYDVPPPEAHPANRFLVEWFGARGERVAEGLRVCSHDGCGRPETRAHEFRRCSVCGTVNYCSRACQALHWKVAHKVECTAANIAEAPPRTVVVGR